MKRKSDWCSALETYLRELQKAEFHYGQLDCCLFVFGAIEAQTGVDLGEQFRGLYGDRKGSLRVIKEYCGAASLHRGVSALMQEYGISEISSSLAQRGDPVLIRKGESSVSLGIVAMNGREALALSDQGIWRLPLSLVVKAWHLA